ncbi:putative reverse transcriptase domain-containing protein, partial [Tanacetum coccineum]
SGVKDKILAAQSEASKVENVPTEMLCGLDQQMEKNEDSGLYFMDRNWVLLVGSVRTLIMDEVYTLRYSVHPGADKMYYDLRDMYWWPCMKKSYSSGNEIRITMDFITKLPRYSKGYGTIWVIVDTLTKSAYFLAIREDYKMDKLAGLYIDDIVTRHGVLVLIIFDRDGRFTLRF